MRTFLLLCLFASSAFAQLNISNPFYTAGLLKPAAVAAGPTLDDTGLIVRYYIDEAASGTTPTDVLDGSGVGTDFDLTLDYGSGNLAYTEVSGNRGLESTSTTGTQKARKAIASGDKVYDNLNATKTVTIELVIRLDSANASGSRLFAFNDRSGSAPDLGINATSTTVWQVYWEGIVRDTFNAGTARTVLHMVIDTDIADADDRLVVYQDGTLLTTTRSVSVIVNDTLSTLATEDLIAFNRESSGAYDRSWDGILFYAAIYDVAFSSARVSDHYDILTANDDTP